MNLNVYNVNKGIIYIKIKLVDNAIIQVLFKELIVIYVILITVVNVNIFHEYHHK